MADIFHYKVLCVFWPIKKFFEKYLIAPVNYGLTRLNLILKIGLASNSYNDDSSSIN